MTTTTTTTKRRAWPPSPPLLLGKSSGSVMAVWCDYNSFCWMGRFGSGEGGVVESEKEARPRVKRTRNRSPRRSTIEARGRPPYREGHARRQVRRGRQPSRQDVRGRRLHGEEPLRGGASTRRDESRLKVHEVSLLPSRTRCDGTSRRPRGDGERGARRCHCNRLRDARP